MEKITLLDTAIGSTNKGDEIIMECAKEELGYLMEKYFVLSTPTHLSAFTAAQNLWKLPDSAREIATSKYKFVCGTNLFSTNMLHRCCQWNIDIFNSKPIEGSIFVGVGSNTKEKLNFYTKRLYKKVLSKEFIHSVREEKAYTILTNMGFKCINTGCVTLWKLTDKFCESIPKRKADSVIFTLTDYNKNPQKDKEMINILKKSYNKVYFWIQGIYDLDYLQSLTSIDDIEIITGSVRAYQELLNKDVDYVGTRLHAGIYAMRHKRRAIILAVDDRMNSMKASIRNNCMSRNEISNLEEMIHSNFETKVYLDFDLIEKWKKQFE